MRIFPFFRATARLGDLGLHDSGATRMTPCAVFSAPDRNGTQGRYKDRRGLGRELGANRFGLIQPLPKPLRTAPHRNSRRQFLPDVYDRKAPQWSCNASQSLERCRRQKGPTALDTIRCHTEAIDIGSRNNECSLPQAELAFAPSRSSRRG